MIQRTVQRLPSSRVCSLVILAALLTALWTTGAAGFWYGLGERMYTVYLPLVLRNH